MTSFELAKVIRKAICDRAAQVFTYTSWGDDFALKEIRSIPESIKGASNFDAIDPNDFTVEELKELEFYLWNNSNLYLMPLWMLPFIKEEVDLGCINGKRRIFRRDEIDNDERRGFLAYGVYKD